MAVTWKRLTAWLGIAALAVALPACSLPVRTAPPALAAVPPPPDAAPAPAEPQVRQVRFDSATAAPPTAADGNGAAAWANLQANWTPTPPETDRPHADFHDRLWADIEVAKQDYCNFYSWGNLALYGLGIGAAAPLANTSADERFRHYYQSRLHGQGTDGVANVVNYAGQLWVVAPVATELLALSGHAPADYATDGGWFEWSNRSLRAIAVGFPPVVALYGILGSARPGLNGSHWQPFNDIHGVSGHTFIGAVPFLTAASMTDNPLLQVPLVAGSFLTGWSRIHLDRHYLSQVALGWWSAFLAVRSVNKTEAQRSSAVSFSPVTSEGPGVGVEVRY